ncbi:MAG: sugar ABC transporter permease [Anaerolineae bacterium]|nr:MAG: sugar ABC transporter permease [Anaerolineae bacterium]
MGSRVIVWIKQNAYSPKAARTIFIAAAALTVILVSLYAAWQGLAGTEEIVRSAILLSALGLVISTVMMNRLKLASPAAYAIRSTLMGGTAWMLVMVVANLFLGGEINGINAGVLAIGGAMFGLLAGAIAANVSYTQSRKPQQEILVSENPTLVERLSEFGGVGLPVLLALFTALGAWIATKAYGLQQGSNLGDKDFDALLMRGPSVAFMTIMLQNIFTTAPTFMLMYLAALQDVSPTLYEAAQIDGANPWQRFTKITVPLLRPVTLLVVVLSTIGTLQLFDQIAIITRGGPLDTTLVPVYLIYTTALGSQIQARVGYASAMAFILGAIIFAFTYIQRRYLEEGTEGY